jgi:Amt family ammonium transporter
MTSSQTTQAHAIQEPTRQIGPYEARIAAETHRRTTLADAIAPAIEAGEITVHYQPIVSLKRNKVIAVEAFARWVHPTFGAITPAEFVPLAEARGCVSRLPTVVLARAAEDLMVMRKRGNLPTLSLALNISPHEFADIDLTRRIATVLDAHRLSARALQLEITESVVAFDHENVAAELKRLRKYGLRIALTNAGTSGSTAELMKSLPVDILKIDRSYTAALTDEPNQGSFVEAIVALAASFRVPVVAEGIEDIPQLVRVRELGIQMAQGYLWRPPVPVDQLAMYLFGQAQRRSHGLRRHLPVRRTVNP